MEYLFLKRLIDLCFSTGRILKHHFIQYACLLNSVRDFFLSANPIKCQLCQDVTFRAKPGYITSYTSISLYNSQTRTRWLRGRLEVKAFIGFKRYSTYFTCMSTQYVQHQFFLLGWRNLKPSPVNACLKKFDSLHIHFKNLLRVHLHKK